MAPNSIINWRIFGPLLLLVLLTHLVVNLVRLVTDLMWWTASAPGIAMCQSVAVESHMRESRPWRKLPQ